MALTLQLTSYQAGALHTALTTFRDRVERHPAGVALHARSAISAIGPVLEPIIRRSSEEPTTVDLPVTPPQRATIVAALRGALQQCHEEGVDGDGQPWPEAVRVVLEQIPSLKKRSA